MINAKLGRVNFLTLYFPFFAFRCLKNSIWRRRFSASFFARYLPNTLPVVSDITTYSPLTFLIIRIYSAEQIMCGFIRVFFFLIPPKILDF